jgi:hypothetical protein
MVSPELPGSGKSRGSEDFPASAAGRSLRAVTSARTAVKRLYLLTASEVAGVAAVVRRRAHAHPVTGFSLAFVLSAVIAAVYLVGPERNGQRWLTACCSERDGYSLHVWLLRLPGSLVAPPPGLPVWGALVQVFVVLAIAEAAVGRYLTVGVGLAGHLASGVAARLLIALGPGVLGGLPRVDGHVLDTGPSAATVALAAYLVVVLRSPILGTAVAAGITAAMFAHSDLAGREHLVAWVVGMLCGVVHVLVLRLRASRASVGDIAAVSNASVTV